MRFTRPGARLTFAMRPKRLPNSCAASRAKTLMLDLAREPEEEALPARSSSGIAGRVDLAPLSAAPQRARASGRAGP